MKTIFTFYILLFLIDCNSTRTEDPKWIEFPAGLSHALVEKDDQLSVRIPVNLLAGAPDAANVIVNRRDILSASGRPSSLAEAFTLTWVPDKKDAGPALLVSAKTADLLPGNYTLLVEFVQKEPVAGQQPQTATFTLERSAPKLVSLRSIGVWQERRWPFGTNNTSGTLNLHEEGKKAAAREITFHEVRNPPGSPGPETGELEVKMDTAVVPANGEVAVEVVPVGDFPLGKTTGKLRVNSPQFAAPLIVDYEVVASRTPILIAICAAFGAGLGWLSRFYFQSRRELFNAQITASQALALLLKAQDNVHDAKFKATVEKAIVELKDVAAKRKPAEITTAATQARNTLAAAETELGVRRKALSDALVPLHRKLFQGWRLPLRAAKALNGARMLASDILALAERQYIEEATEKLDQEMPKSRLSLANAASEWRADAAKYFEDLLKHLPALPDQGAERMREAVAAWKKQFGDARISPGVDDSALELELSTTHSAYVQAIRIIDDLREGALEISEWVKDIFVPPSTKTPFEELLAIAKQHGVDATSDIELPGERRQAPAVRQREVQKAWETALLSVLPKGADSKLVTTELKKGQWISAVQIAQKMASPPDPEPPTETALGGVPESGDLTSSSQGLKTPIARGVIFQVSPVFGTTSLADTIRAPRELTGSRSERIELAKEEGWMSLAQSAILWAVFIILAYAIYGSQWIGTSREMIGVFAWAYGLDIAADSLSPLLKKAGTPS